LAPTPIPACAGTAPRACRSRSTGTQAYGDLLLGGQISIGPWIIKPFVGITGEQHRIAPFDDENPVQGQKTGFKAVLETWLTMGDTAYLQTDFSWSQVFEAYSARTRIGTRLTPSLSAGLEAASVGNMSYSAGRGGLFLRYEWGGGEVSASAGAAGDRSGVDGAYGSLGILLRF
jgi:hypothetical protein